MLRKLGLDEFSKLAKEPKRIIAYQEWDVGETTPVQAYDALAQKGEPAALFEVVEEAEDQHKSHSYLGFRPLAAFKSKNDTIEITDKGRREKIQGRPHDELRTFIKRFAPSPSSKHPPFADGIFGFAAYDSVRLMVPLPDKLPDPDEMPDLYFIVYEAVIIFDHFRKTMSINISADSTADYKDIFHQIELIRRQITDHPFKFTLPGKEADLPIQVDIEDELYKERVLRIKEFIHKGHVFQMVLSRSFSTPVHATPFQIYLTLSKLNPSPYMFLFDTGEFAIVGASPEKLVSHKDGYIEAMPIGGTHPKDASKNIDEMRKDLLSDPKEVAEHIMKMEVGRNDLSSVAEPGSVNVLELTGTRAFSHVIHIITKIGAALRKDKDVIDLIKAMLPAAPISGSPKWRALELIEEFEMSRRGFYGGAICLIDTKGNMLSSITIRSILIKKGMAKVRAGATIVAYSDPLYESRESRHKAEAPLKALRLIEGGRT